MTEEPESNESSPNDSPDPRDLESLLGGLDLTPNWAKGEPGVTQPHRQDRSSDRRGGGGPRKPRESARRGLQGVRVKPRRESAPRGGGGGNRYDDNRADFRGDPRRGGDSGGGGWARGPRAPRVPVHVDFIPEKKRLSKVVKVIRQSHRVYPLRVVAEKFMENPAFIAMKYTVKEKDPRAEDFQLWVCRANGMVFSDEQACIQYVIDHGIDANYESVDKEVAPPAGNFVCIGRHRPSGRLIGPPNWHGYQTRLLEARATIAPDTPPEHFASDIEMVHDAEVIEAWKKEVSVQTFYREKLEEPPKADVSADAGSDQPSDPSDESAVSDPALTEASGASEEQAPTAEAEPAAEEPAPEAETAAGADSPPEEETAETQAEETQAAEAGPSGEAPAVEPAQDERPYEMSREEVEKHFRETYLPKLVGKSKRHILPGYLFPKMTDPSLLSLTEYHLRREHDRPNSIVFALRPAFKHMRLHVFRYDGELMVSGIPQHPLPADQKVTPEIQSIVDHVAANPGCNTQEALKAVSNTVDEIPAETVSHFRWLIEKGHVLEFHDDTLHLPHGQKS